MPTCSRAAFIIRNIAVRPRFGNCWQRKRAASARRFGERGSERAKAEGQPYIDRGWQAVKTNSIEALVKADIDFHHFIYELSGNPMIAETSSPHWAYLRCVMGAVLMSGGTPANIWKQHEAIMQAVSEGDVERAGQLASTHISYASGAVQRKIADDEASNPQQPGQQVKRA